MSTTAEIIQSMQTNLSNAYTSLENKGATLPEKKNLENLSGTIDSISSGSSSDYHGEYFIKVVDYNGTIIDEKWLNSGDTYALPTPPTHDRLVFQEWSCSTDIVENTITIEDNNVMVGPVYTTKSGLSEFDVSINPNSGLTITFSIDGEKNWGDGTINTETTHTYTNYGEYTISCNITSLPSSTLFGQEQYGSPTNLNYLVRRVYLSNVTSLGSYCLLQCRALEEITLPTSVSGNVNTFRNCSRLKSIIFPKGVTSVSCTECNNLKYIVLPNTITSISNDSIKNHYIMAYIALPTSITSMGYNNFTNMYSLQNLILPELLTGSLQSSFNACSNLKKIKIPSGITTLKNVFGSCLDMDVYDFSSLTQIPSLTSGFSYINNHTKIYVPDELYDSWITETNWATYANYIYKASEMEA